MNPNLNYSPVGTHDCPTCGHQIEVNYDTISCLNNIVQCESCKANFKVDVDAEFIGGVWYDKTKLIPEAAK